MLLYQVKIKIAKVFHTNMKWDLQPTKMTERENYITEVAMSYHQL